MLKLPNKTLQINGPNYKKIKRHNKSNRDMNKKAFKFKKIK